MTAQALPDSTLIERYGVTGPRYTSYPSALEFSPDIGDAELAAALAAGNDELIPPPLSLYVHIPFCRSLCYYCGCEKKVTRSAAVVSGYLQTLGREIAAKSALIDSDRQVRQLHLGGGTPTYLDAAQRRELLTTLRRHFRFVDDPDREYSIEVDPRTLLGHEMAGLAELGFNRVSLGVQDLDQRVQLAVNRRQSEARIARLIDAARRHGIDTVSVDLIYGLPLQTTHTFKATLARIVELGPDTLSIYNYAHLPSRFPAQRLLRAKYLPSADERLAIFSMAIDYLTNAGYDYIGMDHFARPDSRLATAQRDGTLHRCFQGYSTHRGCDILGFGASAISRVGEGYFQTIKRLPDYAATIDGGGLAITRGVALTADDERRAAVIQAIMCDGRIDKQALGSEFGVDFDDAFATELAALAPLERDGLVRLGADVIDITPVGRILLRSIAGVFDAYRADAARENRCSRIV